MELDLAAGFLLLAGFAAFPEELLAVDFFAVDFRITRRFNSQPDLASFDLENDDFDIVVDGDAFAEFTSKY